jgi:hypothetical protein
VRPQLLWLLRTDQEFQRSAPGYPDSADSFFQMEFSLHLQFWFVFLPSSVYIMSPSGMPPFVEFKPALGNLLYGHTTSTPVPFFAAYADRAVQ